MTVFRSLIVSINRCCVFCSFIETAPTARQEGIDDSDEYEFIFGEGTDEVLEV